MDFRWEKQTNILGHFLPRLKGSQANGCRHPILRKIEVLCFCQGKQQIEVLYLQAPFQIAPLLQEVGEIGKYTGLVFI